MPETKYDGCGRQTPSFEIIQYGSVERGYKSLCRRCFNHEAASAAWLTDFEHFEFNPIRSALIEREFYHGAERQRRRAIEGRPGHQKPERPKKFIMPFDVIEPPSFRLQIVEVGKALQVLAQMSFR